VVTKVYGVEEMKSLLLELGVVSTMVKINKKGDATMLLFKALNFWQKIND
jgi:hypothetical protein